MIFIIISSCTFRGLCWNVKVIRRACNFTALKHSHLRVHWSWIIQSASYPYIYTRRFNLFYLRNADMCELDYKSQTTSVGVVEGGVKDQ
jgi:hypothetical protein